MYMENFVHKCDSCKKHIATCDSVKPLFAEDRINPMQSIPGDTVLWCDAYEGAKNTERQVHPVEPRTKVEIINIITKMSEEQRLEVIKHFCPHCGGFSPCQCWNDE